MLYDHNMIAKAYPFDGSARIPFIMRLPKQYQTATKTVDQVVELRDLLPTFCDLADAEVPDMIDGQSILPLCRNEADGWREDLHGEHTSGEWSNQWLTDGHEKYVWLTPSGRELLFDLQNDPTELHDLSGERPERVAYWRSRLIEELDGREEDFVQDGELVAGRPQRPVLSNPGRYSLR